MIKVRGISNDETGTACHLASALIILCHCLVPLRQAVVQVATTTGATQDDPSSPILGQSSTASLWLVQLGSLLQELITNNDDTTEEEEEEEAVQPTATFYNAVKRRLGIEAHELGDAVTALIKILQSIREDLSTTLRSGDGIVQSLFQQTTDGGRVHSIITGVQRERIDWNVVLKLTRTKVTKTRPMTCPWTLSLPELVVPSSNSNNNNDHADDDDSLLQKAVGQALKPQPVRSSYCWKEGTYAEVEEEEEFTTEKDDLDNGFEDVDDEWYITKKLVLDAVPAIWLIHVGMKTNATSEDSNSDDDARRRRRRMKVPAQLQVSTSATDEAPFPSSYHLIGAILHVSDDSDSNDGEADEEPSGHYVAVVRKQKDSDNEGEEEKTLSSWFLVDDDKVTRLSSLETVLQLLNGDVDSCCNEITTNGGGSITAGCGIHGTLLVYQRDSQEGKESYESLVQSTLEQIQNALLLSGITTDENEIGGEMRSTQTQKEEEEDLASYVGRRIRVKWARGKYYSGTVTAYDASSGKHQVVYVDGDIREYNLAKKTFEWEDG